MIRIVKATTAIAEDIITGENTQNHDHAILPNTFAMTKIIVKMLASGKPALTSFCLLILLLKSSGCFGSRSGATLEENPCPFRLHGYGQRHQ
jgi:hypothetical protein